MYSVHIRFINGYVEDFEFLDVDEALRFCGQMLLSKSAVKEAYLTHILSRSEQIKPFDQRHVADLLEHVADDMDYSEMEEV